MSEDDTEIQLGKSRVYLGKDNIVYATPIGNIDEKIARTFQQHIFEYANRIDGKINSLVDLSNSGIPSAKARKIGKDALNHEKVGKPAFYGLNPVTKMLASFAMGKAKNKNMRFFKTKEEALKWLME